jgi:haloalkane dehalogenase
VEVFRTPEDRFSNLPDFSFTPHYLEWNGLRLHYVDEGEGRPVMLFHGEPTWSFLYRTVATVLIDAGHRVVAADLPGFGRSDKPTDPDFYTYDRHTAAIQAVVEHLDLREAAGVVQDWGGPIGLRVAVEAPERFDRLVVLNTGLFTGHGRPSPGFLAWRSFVEQAPDLPVRSIMRRSMIQEWPDEVLDAYEAPFPSLESKVGAHRFPLIVPLQPDDEGAAEMADVADALGSWDRPTLVLFSTEDPVFSTRAGERLAEMIPGAGPLETVEGAGHFLQEDRGLEVGFRIAAFLARTA